MEFRIAVGVGLLRTIEMAAPFLCRDGAVPIFESRAVCIVKFIRYKYAVAAKL